jgi:hypothetical protein
MPKQVALSQFPALAVPIGITAMYRTNVLSSEYYLNGGHSLASHTSHIAFMIITHISGAQWKC